MRVGFVGLGNMGLPMASNLLAAGFELHVHNRTRSKAEHLQGRGAEVSASLAELARRTDIVLACLANVAVSKTVFLDADGLIGAASPGQILIDHSTVDPETSRRLHAAAARRGVHFLDAPISGGPEGAAAATLTIMVGGNATAIAEARPVLEAVGARIEHMGGPGAGAATKLANQLLVGVHTLAAAEALLLGIRAGVDAGKLAALLTSAWGDSRMLRRNAPIIDASAFRPSAAPIRNLVKDLGMIVELASSVGLELPAASQALRINQSAADQGMASDDIAAIFRLLERERRP